MRRAFALAAAVLAVLFAGAGPAGAAPFDDVTLTMDYSVTKDGVLQVTETIVYEFGSSGRHGIYRDLVIREPYRDDPGKDQKYEVDNIRVTSKDANDDFSTETTRSNGHRDQVLRIKIGSEDEYVGSKATYVIKYDVRGALRHFDDHSELYWDATGSAWDAVIKRATVNVEVPDGVQRVECFAGPAGSTTACPRKTVTAGKATFGADNLARSQQLTIVAGIKAGVVSNDTPIVVDPPDWLERYGLNLPGLVGSGAVALLALLGALVYARQGNKDQRFAGLPPGTFPPAGATVATVKDGFGTDQLPVAFAPPRIPVAEGGLLIDAKATTTETAATLIDLAVRGGLKIENTGNEQFAVLVDPRVATTPHEQALISGLFPSLTPGQRTPLRRRRTGDTSMADTHNAVIAALREQIRQRDWYTRMPRAGGGTMAANAAGCGCFAGFFVLIFGSVISAIIGSAVTDSPGPLIMFGIPVLALIVLLGVWIGKRAQGQRSAAGRTVADQLVGFRKYLATAEVDQLRFEEGEDIFSKYLPWAIAFGLADRWQRVCAQLVAAGQLTPDPGWYVGPSYYGSGWSASSMSSTVASTFSPPPTPSGSGGGSSSGFSGGSSGGGGGGGGGGSW